MNFLYPIGLWGLLGIPLLIIVYILKNRYTEQTIASTYMWTLSQRFLKKRNPLSRITGLISLILQLLLVAVISFAVAHPIITLPGAAREYCFVLDASASMNMKTENKTRFEDAKSEIGKIIDKAESGSAFSLVYVGDSTETVFELETDKDLAKKRIEQLKCSNSKVDYSDSIVSAQRYFNENPATLTYLVTDTDCSEHTNVEVINVAKSEVNVSVYDISYEENKAGSEYQYTVNGKAVCYGGDVMTDIEVYCNIDDRLLGSVKLNLKDGESYEFSIQVKSEEFYSLTVISTRADALESDNTATVYNVKNENSYNALLISNTPFFLKSAIDSVSTAKVEEISVEEYKKREAALMNENSVISGYGLYIYDGFTPNAIPTDGSVWFVGPTANVEGSGFSVQGVDELDEGVKLELNKSSSSVMKKITEGLKGGKIYIKKYTKCGVYGNFSTIFSYMGSPLVFTGNADAGNREVVFAFNFHESNFALSSDYPVLVHNLLEYSFPAVVETTEYSCGELAEVNVISGCESIRVDPPSGEAFYADTNYAVSEFKLTEVGEYKITLNVSGNEREFYIYSSVPEEERDTAPEEQAVFSLRGEPSDKGSDGTYDPLVLLFVLAAVLFAAEWVVYCYEKYQLR